VQRPGSNFGRISTEQQQEHGSWVSNVYIKGTIELPSFFFFLFVNILDFPLSQMSPISGIVVSF
jgi:hypothetical protein